MKFRFLWAYGGNAKNRLFDPLLAHGIPVQTRSKHTHGLSWVQVRAKLCNARFKAVYVTVRLRLKRIFAQIRKTGLFVLILAGAI